MGQNACFCEGKLDLEVLCDHWLNLKSINVQIFTVSTLFLQFVSLF